MVLIFYGSSDRFSFQHSSRIIEPLLHWLIPHLSERSVHAVIVCVRKASHLSEYAILTILVWRLVRQLRQTPAWHWRWSDAGWSLLIAVLYAASDEFHQRFVPSREASVRDVMIDSIGAVFALLFLWFLGRCRQRW
jgi:VanZ family protein